MSNMLVASKLWAYLFGLALFMVSVSCSTPPSLRHVHDEELLVKEPFDFLVPSVLSEDQLKDDVTLLIYAIENGYGGRKHIPAGDLNRALSELRQLVMGAERPTSPKLLCQRIAQVLASLPDNHLAARLDGKDCNDERQKLSSAGSVGKNIARPKNQPWDLNYRKLDNLNVPILSITSFPKHEDPAWKGFLDTVSKIKKTSPALIIDLRGNGGGDDTMGLTMASYLYGQDFPSPVEVIIKSQTPATFALAANNYRLRILRSKIKGETVPEYLEDRLQKLLSLFQQAQQKQLPPEKSEPGDKGYPFDPKKAFTKPIYLLIDHGCASSCESTLEAFEAHPYAITVGENTGGFLHFGNMGQIALPNSKVVVQLATDYWKRRNGQFLEKIGYSPKIRVPAGKDALEAALSDLISKKTLRTER